MANYTLTNQTAVAAEDASVEWRATTATTAVTPTHSAISRAQEIDTFPQTFNPTGIQPSLRGFLQGRRPVYGMKYPRGYYGY